MKINEILNESIAMPTISVKDVFHVGKLDAAAKRDNSYEGNGLSISTHPEAWRQITRHTVTGDTFSCSKPSNAFINAHKLTKANNKIIADWAIQHKLLVPTGIVRVSWFDDEMESTLYQDFESIEEAKNEYGEDLEDNYTIKIKTSGYKPTDALKQITKNPNMSVTDVLSYVLPLYAEANNYDGVWWQDKLDVMRYSAPRGVIVPSKISSWKFEKVQDETI